MTNGGPPGQTCLANLAPLCRTHHRVKTHSQWTYRRNRDGTYTWTAPTGHQLQVRPPDRRPPPRPAAMTAPLTAIPASRPSPNPDDEPDHPGPRPPSPGRGHTHAQTWFRQAQPAVAYGCCSAQRVSTALDQQVAGSRQAQPALAGAAARLTGSRLTARFAHCSTRGGCGCFPAHQVSTAFDQQVTGSRLCSTSKWPGLDKLNQRGLRLLLGSLGLDCARRQALRGFDKLDQRGLRLLLGSLGLD